MRFLKVFILFLFLPLSVSAQFYVTGDDPGKLKWNHIDTESYRVIYPQGADSLARVYALWRSLRAAICSSSRRMRS